MDERPALRASDADRDRVGAHLQEQLVVGRLTLDEFSDRLDAVHGAVTVEELERLTRDLPAAPVRTRSRTRWSVAIMGNVRRRSRWRIERKTAAVAFMGSCELDLRHAEVVGAEVRITAVAVMGDVRVLVPEGLDVEVTGLALMGDRSEDAASGPLLPGAPFVRVRVFAFMGSVRVRRVDV